MLYSKKSKTLIYAPAQLLTLIFRAYSNYKSQPRATETSINDVKCYHEFFSSLVKCTTQLNDEIAFRKHLYSKSSDLSVRETLEDKIISTAQWLERQDKANANLSESALHNLFYVLELHSFSSDANAIFEKIEAFFLEKNKI